MVLVAVVVAVAVGAFFRNEFIKAASREPTLNAITKSRTHNTIPITIKFFHIKNEELCFFFLLTSVSTE